MIRQAAWGFQLKHYFWIAATAAVTSIPVTGYAQQIPDDVGVAARVPDEYKPIGGRIGTVFVYPALTYDLTGTDNVVASDADRRGDAYVTLAPRVTLARNSQQSSHVVQLFNSNRFHFDSKDENFSEFGVLTRNRWGAVDSPNITFEASAQREVDQRTGRNNVTLARSPVHHGRFDGELAYAFSAGRLSYRFGVHGRRVDFADAISRTGTVIDQDFRDYSQLGGNARLGYRVREGIDVIGQVDYDRFYYDLGPGEPGFPSGLAPDRNSYRVKGEVGLGFDISQRLYGVATIGYLTRKYRDQVPQLRDVSSLSYNINLLWNPTEYLTVRVNGLRDIQETASPLVAGDQFTRGTVAVDYVPTPALLFTASANAVHYNPVGVTTGNATEYGGSLLGRYRLNRRWSVTSRVSYNGRDTNSPIDSFDGIWVSMGIVLTL